MIVSFNSLTKEFKITGDKGKNPMTIPAHERDGNYVCNLWPSCPIPLPVPPVSLPPD